MTRSLAAKGHGLDWRARFSALHNPWALVVMEVNSSPAWEGNRVDNWAQYRRASISRHMEKNGPAEPQTAQGQGLSS